MIIASSRHGDEIYRQLMDGLYPRKKVFLPRYGMLVASVGSHCFECEDVILQEGEVFVDVGMLFGESSLYVAEHCNYKKIYGFEPGDLMVKECRKKLMNYKNIEIFPYAAWDKREELFFNYAGGGSNVVRDGKIRVDAATIDEIIGDQLITF